MALIAALAIGLAGLVTVTHWREVHNTLVTPIALNPEDADQTRVGALQAPRSATNGCGLDGRHRMRICYSS